MEKNELDKCKTDIFYFIEKYCKLLTPSGIENIRLRGSKRRYLKYLIKKQHQK